MDAALLAYTQTLRRHLAAVDNELAVRDLLFLEAWEMNPQPGAGCALRINQIRRANPELAAGIRAELQQISLQARATGFRMPPAPQAAATNTVLPA